jgi:ligand-binding sensor domain-containing protein/two-component sensor histidine kinase
MRLICIIIGLLFLHCYSVGQINYYFRKYNTGSGLIQNTVRTIKQDKLGRLWIGTSEGLSIYDGEEFINYNQEDGLTNLVINCFYEINDSVMLVGSNGSGVYVFHKPTFGKDTLIQIYAGQEYLIDHNVNAIFRDWNNTLWFCTDNGITRWRFSDSVAGKMEVKHFGEDEGIKRGFTCGTADHKNKTLWFGTEAGLIKSDGEKFSLEKDFGDPMILSVHARGDSLVVGTSKKIWVYKTGKAQDFIRSAAKSYSENLQNIVARQIVNDNKGVYWFATSKGLLRYDGKNFTVINRGYGLEEDFLFSITDDKEENLWIGSVNGLFKFAGDSFGFIPRSEKSPRVHKFMHDHKGNFLVSTPDGIYDFLNNKFTYSEINSLFKNYRIDNLLFTENRMWALTSGGIFQFSVDETTGKKELIQFLGKDELAPEYTYNMCVDKSNNAWVSTKSGQLYFINRGEMKLMNYEGRFQGIKLPDDMAMAMYSDSRNNTWLGYFQQGLFKITPDAVLKITEADGFASETVRCIYEDSKGNIWIGTRFSGVFKYAEGKFTHFTTGDGLSSNWVRTIAEDQLGTLWFGTAKGVSAFNGVSWKVYDEAKGIAAGEILASSVSREGTLYFSGSNGIYFYSPRAPSAQVLPTVFIKKFQFIDGRNADYHQNYKRQTINTGLLFNTNSSHPAEKNFKFAHNQNSFVIEFASSSFINENKTEYVYKLEGFDLDWSQSAKRNYISYVNLPAGNYRFLVKAVNSDGFWSETPAEIAFVITPPFWNEWWFRLLVLFLTVGLVALVTTIINRYHLKQVLRIERMRTDIATDLHDDIGSSLTGIAIFSQLVKRELKRGTLTSTEMLDKIVKSSQTLIDSMNDIVWSINPDNDSLEDVILKLEDFAVKLLEAKGMEVGISIPNELKNITLAMDKRRNLLLIFKEMINNVVRHSQASRVFLEVRIENNNGHKELLVAVKDNGVGFCIEEVKKGNGLKNIRTRSALINGKINIHSAKGNGTKYELSVPVD